MLLSSLESRSFGVPRELCKYRLYIVTYIYIYERMIQQVCIKAESQRHDISVLRSSLSKPLKTSNFYN